jgi:DNA-binding HxlR family transcriptional regulator
MDIHRVYRHFCMMARALEVVGERWSLLIVRDLTLGPQRFTDLARGLAGITPTRLTHRLRQLEAAGVVTRTPAAAGREVWYELTEAGHDLGPILEALTLWGIEHALERPRAGERVPPIPTMIGTKMWLSRNAMPQRPVTWVWQFAGEGDYTIDFDHAVWTLSRGAAKVADVTVDATPDAWARLLTTPRGSRRLSEKSIRLAGTQDSIDLFAQSFILELGRRRPARPAGTLHRAT